MRRTPPQTYLLQKHMNMWSRSVDLRIMRFSFSSGKLLFMCFCRQGHKNIAAHERQPFQPLTCSSLSHAGCLLRLENWALFTFLHMCMFFIFVPSSRWPFSSTLGKLYVSCVMPTIPMKCLPAERWVALLMTLMAYEQYLSETAWGDCFCHFPYFSANLHGCAPFGGNH